MQFYNGATDSAQAYALHRIQWNFRYNVLCETCPNDDLFRITIPSARPDANGLYPSEGTFQVQSAPLPYFIPVPFFIRTFGAFVQMRSPIPHRKALFDVYIAGLIAGFLVTLPLLIW